MGLMYVMPIDLDEVDRAHVRPDGTLVLKSYGLPLIFWGYLAAILLVVLAMGLAIIAPLEKLYQTGDPLNQFLALICGITLVGVPLGFISLFFIEVRLEKKGAELKKIFYYFFVPIYSKKIQLQEASPFEILHHLDSPNVAKIQATEEMRGFQNKGYFVLAAKTQGRSIAIDRSNKKVDLKKLETLLLRY